MPDKIQLKPLEPLTDIMPFVWSLPATHAEMISQVPDLATASPAELIRLNLFADLKATGMQIPEYGFSLRIFFRQRPSLLLPGFKNFAHCLDALATILEAIGTITHLRIVNCNDEGSFIVEFYEERESNRVEKILVAHLMAGYYCG